jgi:hypothetical protein
VVVTHLKSICINLEFLLVKSNYIDVDNEGLQKKKHT